MLTAIILSGEQSAIIVLAVIASAAFAALVFKKDLWKIAERRRLSDLNALLVQYGMPNLGKVCQCLADGDLAGAIAEAKYLHRQLDKEDTARTLLRSVFYKQLPDVLANQGDCQHVLSEIAKWAAANPEAAKVAGYVIAAAAK